MSDTFNSMLAQLLSSGDFLQTTLDHLNKAGTEQALNQPICHTIGSHTQLKLLALGAISLEPIQPTADQSYDLILSSGIHGNETAPIELCNLLVKSLLKQEIISKVRLLFILGNPLTIAQKKRFVDYNLNRLFSNAHQDQASCYETKRATLLEGLVNGFYHANHAHLHYDLHTAIRPSYFEKFAIYPYLNNQKNYSKTQLSFLASSDINTVLLSHAPTKTFSYFTNNQFNADSFTLELGKVRDFGQNDLSKLENLKQSLTSLIETGNFIKPKQNLISNLNLFAVDKAIIKQSDQFEFYIKDDCQNFDLLKDGQLISKDNGEEFRINGDDKRIIFPNPNIPIGDWAGLIIGPASLQSLDIQ